MTHSPPLPYTAGLLRRRIVCPHSGRLLPVSFWYPASAAESVRREGIYDLQAAFDAPPVPGKRPLVLISHGSGGSDTNHHDWAEALARSGILAAAPRHIGDSHDVNMGIGSREQLLERPLQLKAALGAALADPVLGRHIDPDRLGILGFSAGGYTSMILLGAQPDFSRWQPYCRRHPGAAAVCPAGRLLNLPRPDETDWRGTAEPRLRSAVLLAPLAMPFSCEAIGRIRVPVRLYRAERDSVADNPGNADHADACLGHPPETVTVPGDHYVFIAPVADNLAGKYPEFYRDAPGIDRRAVHAAIAGEVTDFFRRTLSPKEAGA